MSIQPTKPLDQSQSSLLWTVPDPFAGSGSPGRPELPPTERTSRDRHRKLKRVHHARSMAPGSQAPHVGCAAPSESRPSMPHPSA
jgi:hypothetical protein